MSFLIDATANRAATTKKSGHTIQANLMLLLLFVEQAVGTKKAVLRRINLLIEQEVRVWMTQRLHDFNLYSFHLFRLFIDDMVIP